MVESSFHNFLQISSSKASYVILGIINLPELQNKVQNSGYSSE